MSRFIDRLNRVSQTAPQPMGFNLGQAKLPSSRMLLVANLPQIGVDNPWGGWLKGIGQGEIPQLTGNGADFMIFPAATTRLGVVQDSKLGKILEVEATLGEGMLKAIDELPVDAVIIVGETVNSLLSWQYLMLVQCLSDLITKPLLVPVPLGVTASELQILWETGVDAIVVAVDINQPPGGVAKLRQIVDKLDFPSSRRRGKTGVLVPHLSPATDIDTEEE